MRKTRYLLKYIGHAQGTFQARMGMVKDRNNKNLKEAEDIKKRWQEYTEELYKKGFNDLNNHDVWSLTQSWTFWSVQSRGPYEALL